MFNHLEFSNIRFAKHLTFLSVLLFSVFACASNPQTRPSWIDSPPRSGLVAIGSASYDIFGESKARQNAIKKAMAELAIQKGSSVDILGQVANQKVVDQNDDVKEQSSVTSYATIRGQQIQIKAKIQEYWKDWENKKVWVLVVEE